MTHASPTPRGHASSRSHAAPRSHAVRSSLLALALAAAVPSFALAQDDPGAEQERRDAESAFLRAYYVEIGKGDPAEALRLYRAIAGMDALPTGTRAKVRLGIVRCLRELGRHEEAEGEIASIARDFQGDLAVIAELDALRTPLQQPPEDDLSALVRSALAGESWESRVPSFGPRAVPVLTAMLRAADPSVVYRAGRSLLHIARDGDAAASDALIQALTAKDVLYPADLRDRALSFGPLPERLGRGILALEDTELRDRLIVSATHSNAADSQAWLVQAMQDDTHVRALVFPDAPTGRAGTAALVVRAVCLGPGPARDAALAHLQLYEPRTRGRGRNDEANIQDEDVFFDPPAAFLADSEALRTAAGHVYDESPRERPSPALRDAMLRDPETRELGLAWTWMTGTPVEDRALLVDALSHGWNVPEGRLGNCANTVASSFDTPPTRAEWDRMLDGYTGNLYSVLQIFDSRKLLTADALDACIARDTEGGHDAAAAVALVPNVDDPDWAARALPPLLRSDSANVALSAAQQLLDLHRRGKTDISGAADDLLRLARRPEAWAISSTWSAWVVKALASELGDSARRTLVDALPLGNDGDYHALDTLEATDAPETVDVARRMLFVDLASDDDPRQSLVKRAAEVLVRRAGDEALPDLMRATRGEPKRRRWCASSAVSANAASCLSPEARERWYASLIDDRPDGVFLPPHAAGMGIEAVRRLALKALASDDSSIQVWGAKREEELLDPAAAEPLGRLAVSPDPGVREVARAVLAKMRKAEEDMAWMRAVAARSATREKVDELLRSGMAQYRMAGIAGLVALRAPDALERLLGIAANDADAEVRAEARRALMALGDPRREPPVAEDGGK